MRSRAVGVALTGLMIAGMTGCSHQQDVVPPTVDTTDHVRLEALTLAIDWCKTADCATSPPLVVAQKFYDYLNGTSAGATGAAAPTYP